jgi:hypothetical protein
MSSFRTRKSSDIKVRLSALKNADDFAKKTFIALRKDDSTWHRFLRFFRIIAPQSL